MMWSNAAVLRSASQPIGYHKAYVKIHRLLRDSIGTQQTFCDSQRQIECFSAVCVMLLRRTVVCLLVQGMHSLMRELQVGLCVAAMVSCGMMAGYRSGQVGCLLYWLLVKHCANILLYR